MFVRKAEFKIQKTVVLQKKSYFGDFISYKHGKEDKATLKINKKIAQNPDPETGGVNTAAYM